MTGPVTIRCPALKSPSSTIRSGDRALVLSAIWRTRSAGIQGSQAWMSAITPILRDIPSGQRGGMMA